MDKAHVERAFRRFKEGAKPANYRPARKWYVLDENGEAYPLKAIWAMATTGKTRDMHTDHARRKLKGLGYVILANEELKDFEDQVAVSSELSQEARDKRLKEAPKKPVVHFRVTPSFVRNSDVVATVLARAGGQCERCDQPAPFTKSTDGEPYLEIHHKKRLADDGDDTVENAYAVCPNCHRELHFGEGRDQAANELKRRQSETK